MTPLDRNIFFLEYRSLDNIIALCWCCVVLRVNCIAYLLLVPEHVRVSDVLRVAGGVGTPQAAPDLQVREADHAQGQEVLDTDQQVSVCSKHSAVHVDLSRHTQNTLTISL